MIDTLQGYIAHLETAVERTAPLSPRMRVLTSMVRFAERALAVHRQVPGDPGFRRVALMLEVRDLARAEQAWIDSLFREQVWPTDQEDALLLYKMMLAVTEATTVQAIAYVGPETEDTEAAQFWAQRAGRVMGETLAIVPHFLVLPEDRLNDNEA